MKDLIGYTLEQAKEILERNIYHIQCVKLSRAPKDNNNFDEKNSRVIAIKEISKNNIEIWVVKSLWKEF